MIEIPFLRPELPPVEDWAPKLKASYESNQFTNFGPLERGFANRCREDYAATGYEAVPVTNATAGLTAALIGMGITGRVLMPAFTFPATMHSIVMAGCEPVVLDVDPVLWELDTGAVERVLNEQEVGAVVAVRTYGFYRDQSALLETCAKYDCPVLLDSAAALGHPDQKGMIGSAHGEVEVFSLHATKPFGIGEGGLVIAPEKIAGEIRSVINFGIKPDRSFSSGGNMKLDEVRASIGLAMLDRIGAICERRAELANRYNLLLEPLRAVGLLSLPQAPGKTPWQCFPVRCATTQIRDLFAGELNSAKIRTRPYYSPNIATGYHGSSGALVPAQPLVSNALSNEMLCLPLNHTLTQEENRYLFDVIGDLANSFRPSI